MPVTVRPLPPAPEYLRPFVREETSKFWLHDTCYEFALIDTDEFCRHYPSAPRRFALNHDGFVALSDTIERQDRPLVAYHESIEYDGSPLDEHSCLRALEKELAAAKYFGFGRLSFNGYIERRLAFFAGLIEYYERKCRSDEEDALLARLYKSRSHLHSVFIETAADES